MTNLLHSYYNNIQGIHIIDSKIKGPTIGIIACTHGGETVGIKVIKKIEQLIKQKNHILKGKIICILANIQAYKKNRELQTSVGKRKENMIISRYIEENLNRCCDSKSLKNPISYERRRANELTPVLKSIDIVIDIHSTTHPSGSTAIHTQKSYPKFKNILNTDDIYINLIETIKGKPLIDITNRAGGIGICIETGCQADISGYKTGLDNVCRILSSLKVLGKIDLSQNKIFLPKKKNKKYSIIGSIMMHDATFKPVKQFKNLEKIKKGEPIAYEAKKIIYAKEDCLIIMPGLNKPGEEYCFLAKPLSSIIK
ncbi:MAG: succinylglutamate desuccinylase/aspartoacylase family protein [Candidatus Absconditabacterales bacterium]